MVAAVGAIAGAVATALAVDHVREECADGCSLRIPIVDILTKPVEARKKKSGKKNAGYKPAEHKKNKRPSG